MFTSLLGTTFIEFLKDEWLGLIASVIILVSFLMSSQIKTRIINMVGCIAFVIYGLLLPTYSTAFMNFAVLVVHIVFLTRHFVKLRREKKAMQEEEQVKAESSLKEENQENAESPEKEEDGAQQD